MTTGLLVLLAISLVCCEDEDRYDPRQYHGDGTLEAERLDAPFDCVIYTLNLGAIDFSHPGMREFSMDSLPAQYFTPRLAVTPKDRESAARAGIWFNPSVRLRIHNESGSLVCEVVGPLAMWAGALDTTAADYGAADEEAIIWAPRAGSKPCIGFTPRSRHRYKVKVEVSRADPRASDFTAMLQLYSYPK